MSLVQRGGSINDTVHIYILYTCTKAYQRTKQEIHWYTHIPTLKSTDVYDVKCIKHAPREQTSNQCTNNNAIAEEEYTIDQALV